MHSQKKCYNGAEPSHPMNFFAFSTLFTKRESHFLHWFSLVTQGYCQWLVPLECTLLTSRQLVRVSDPVAPGQKERLNITFFWWRVYIDLRLKITVKFYVAGLLIDFNNEVIQCGGGRENNSIKVFQCISFNVNPPYSFNVLFGIVCHYLNTALMQSKNIKSLFQRAIATST